MSCGGRIRARSHSLAGRTGRGPQAASEKFLKLQNRRKQIWKSVFPDTAPLKNVNLDSFAERFELSGSSIKNVAVAAAFLAAADGSSIKRYHLTQAVRDEYNKTGRVLMEHELF